MSSGNYTNPENDETSYRGDDDFQFDQPQPLVPGRRFGEHQNYRLDRKLGEGGMGQVWLATEIEGGEELRQVVCKLLPKPVQDDAPEMEQIRKVFELTQTLVHTNICLLRGMKKDPDFGWFFVMDYANGESLYTWFTNQPNYKNGVKLETLLPILKPLAEALDYAHSRNVVHRDIKPQNVMFTTVDGKRVPWLVDFGIAARIHQTVTMTMGVTEASYGTPGYKAPEQLQKATTPDGQKKAMNLDGRTDQYAFATMTYQLLAGHLPFEGDALELAMQILRDAPDELPNQPAHVNAALQKALSKDKKDRFASCSDFVKALEKPVAAPSKPTPPPVQSQPKSSPSAHVAPESKNPLRLVGWVVALVLAVLVIRWMGGCGKKAEEVPKGNTTSLEVLSPSGSPFIDQFYKEHKSEIDDFKKQVGEYEAILQRYQSGSKKAKDQEAVIRDASTKLYQAYQMALEQRKKELAQYQAEELRPDQPEIVQATQDIEYLEKTMAHFAPEATLEMILDGVKAFHKAGDRMVKTVDGIEYAFRWCPAGKFTMGSPRSEKDRDTDETQHEVTLTQGFWMMETEVTQAMWRSVMGNNPSRFKGADRPVECVSWNDCQAFCKKLTSKIGMKITLPTEAQWEYACRAGTTGPYAGELDKIAWYDGNSGTHPVGQKQANAWGLYDMHGNVYEWCQDWDGDYPTGSVEDPTGPNSGSYRVRRGGSWLDNAQDCRSANRFRYSAGNRNFILGFRVVGCPSR